MVKSIKQSATKTRNKELKLRGKPRRSLSPYNIFFAIQRKKLLHKQRLKAQDKKDGHVHIGFANLAKIVAEQWKNIDPISKAELEEKAQQDKIRHTNEMREWKLKLKMEAELEVIEKEVKATNGVGDALLKIQDMKKELEQMKQSSIKAKVQEKKDTVPAAKPKTDGDIELEGCYKDSKSAAADLSEALSFLEETLDCPNSPGDSFADGYYTPVHNRSVFGTLATSAEDACTPSKVANMATPNLSYMGNVDLGIETRPPVPYCSTCIPHRQQVPTNVTVPTYTQHPYQPLLTDASPFARRNSMPTASGLQAPTGMYSRNTMRQYDSSYFSGFRGLRHDYTGEPSHWPPLSELQRFFGIDSSSQRSAAASHSRRHSTF